MQIVFSKDGDLASLFAVLGDFFTTRPNNSRSREALGDAEEEEAVGEGLKESEGGEVTQGEVAQEEGEEGVGEKGGEGGETEPPTHDEYDEPVDGDAPQALPSCPTTPVKKTLSFEGDDDPMNELLAFRMGGESMVKPTPSPGPTWAPSPGHGSPTSPSALADSWEWVQKELARVEYLGSIPIKPRYFLAINKCPIDRFLEHKNMFFRSLVKIPPKSVFRVPVGSSYLFLCDILKCTQGMKWNSESCPSWGRKPNRAGTLMLQVWY